MIRGAMTRTRLVVTLYFCLALAYLWPLPIAPAHLIADAPIHTDGYLFLWNASWLADWAIGMTKGGLFTCNRLFYPDGCDLSFHTLSPLSAVPSAVANVSGIGMDGMVMGQNLRILASFVLAAWIAYRLARRTVGRPAAFVAGFVFSFTAYHVNETPRLHLVGIELIPWVLLTGLRLLDRPTFRRAVPFGAVVAAAFWDAPDYALYAVVFVAPAFAWRVARSPGRWRRVAAGLGAVFVFAVLVFPLARARLEHLRDHGVLRSAAERMDFSLAPVDVVWPDRHHPAYGRLTDRPVATPIYERASTSLFGGFVPIALALLGLAIGRGKRRFVWAAGLAVALALAAGPRLAFGDWPSPHALLERVVPALGASRTPVRFVAVVWMFAALLAGEAIGAIGSRRRATVFVIVAVLAIFLERGRASLGLERVDVPSHCRLLPVLPPGAILNVPLETVNHDHLAQIGHGRPLVVANVPRANDATLALAFATPVLAAWLSGRASGADPATLRDTGDALARFGVPFVTVNTTLARLRRSPPGRDHGALAAELVASGFRVVSSDDRVTLYQHRSVGDGSR